MKIRPYWIILASALLSFYTCETLAYNASTQDRALFSIWFSAKNTNPKHSPVKNTGQIWERIRLNYGIRFAEEQHHQIQRQIKKYSAQDKMLYRCSHNAKPYIYHIVEQLERRGMPSELALLPMIESGFLPKATSPKGAAGLWQFMPATGKQYGLRKKGRLDERRDLVASTRAALDYLEFLHDEFNHDWMLALAAYNSGEGTVQRAIQKNLRAGKSTSFWSLSLPKETKDYVPKLLALAEVIKNPDKHDISLAVIHNQPYQAAIKN